VVVNTLKFKIVNESVKKTDLIVGGTRLRFDGPGPIISDVGGVE
jgi:hypothetical protein